MQTDEKQKEIIDTFLKKNRSAILHDIASLVNIKSVSKPDASGKPFGEGCAKALDTALAMGSALGFASKNYDYYCGKLSMGKGPELAMIAHLDVVPEGSDWKYNPYNAVIVDDKYIIGRGVSDDKGAAVAALYAMKCLKELGMPLKHQISLILGCSEEAGMEDLKYYLKKEKPPVFAFTPDAEFPVCIGEKGMLTIDLTSQQLSGNIVSFEGGLVFNMVADRASAVLCDVELGEVKRRLDEEFEISQVTKGVKVLAKGVSAHAAEPKGSVNAIQKLAAALVKTELVTGEHRLALEFIAQLLSDDYGISLGINCEDEPSGKLTKIGGKISYQDGVFVQNINIRYPVTASGNEILRKISESIKKAGFTAENVVDSAPSYLPADSAEVQTLMEVYREVTGRDEQPYTMGGGTYARHLPNAVAFGLGFVGSERLSKEPNRGGVHQPDEELNIECLLSAIKVFILALLRLDQVLE